MCRFCCHFENFWDARNLLKNIDYNCEILLQYADLDEFLSENNIPDGLPGTHLGHSGGLGHRSDSLSHAAGLSLGLGHITTKRERSPSPSDCISPDTLNPPSPAESSEYEGEAKKNNERDLSIESEGRRETRYQFWFHTTIWSILWGAGPTFRRSSKVYLRYLRGIGANAWSDIALREYP